MNVLSHENIQKLVRLGFEEEEVIKALSFKKSVPLATHWLYSQQSVKFTSSPSSIATESHNYSQKLQCSSSEINSKNNFTWLENYTQDNIPAPEIVDLRNENDEDLFDGEIKFLDDEKFFGFIKFDDTDIFFHYSDKLDKTERLAVGEEVVFKIGENRNPGRNMGRLCAKKVRLKTHLDNFSRLTAGKREGYIVEQMDRYGLVEDKETCKSYMYLYNENDRNERFNKGDAVLFYFKVEKRNGVSITSASQLELIPKTTVTTQKRRIADLTKNHFYRFDIYPADESRSVEFKSLAKTNNVLVRILDIVEKYLVAFLNAEGGQTLFGILDNGQVLGVKLTRKTRDEIRLGIDALVAHIRPAVHNDLYKVIFYPVFDRVNHIEDYYVLCVECKKGNDIYVDSKSNAWIRRDGSVRTMSISMAKMLWQKRLEETKQISFNNNIDLKTLIRNAVNNELNNGVNSLQPQKQLNSIDGTENSPISLLELNYSNDNPIIPLTKKQEKTNDFINLDELDSIDTLGFGTNDLLIDAEKKKPAEMAEAVEKTAENEPKDILEVDVVGQLEREGFPLGTILETVYHLVKKDPKLNKNKEKLIKTARKRLKERENGDKSNENELQKAKIINAAELDSPEGLNGHKTEKDYSPQFLEKISSAVQSAIDGIKSDDATENEFESTEEKMETKERKNESLISVELSGDNGKARVKNSRRRRRKHRTAGILSYMDSLENKEERFGTGHDNFDA